MNELKQVDWPVVCNENNPEIALNVFMNLLMEMENLTKLNKHRISEIENDGKKIMINTKLNNG